MPRHTRTRKPKPTQYRDNLLRAQWAERALDQFAELTFGGRRFADLGEDQQTAVGDLLCNLQHLCQQYGLQFEDALHGARTHFAYETGPDYQDGDLDHVVRVLDYTLAPRH
jgi:hypothetical protein